jgi:hypothetical protein
MEENKNAEQDATKKNSLLDKAEEVAGKISEKAGKVWDKVEHESEEAWNKAKNSELAGKAK